MALLEAALKHINELTLTNLYDFVFRDVRLFL